MSCAANVVKECGEEAGVPPPLAATARPAGCVSYAGMTPEGLKRDVLFVYDLELPADFQPAPQVPAATAAPAGVNPACSLAAWTSVGWGQDLMAVHFQRGMLCTFSSERPRLPSARPAGNERATEVFRRLLPACGPVFRVPLTYRLLPWCFDRVLPWCAAADRDARGGARSRGLAGRTSPAKGGGRAGVQDGEVQEFTLLPVEEVARLVSSTTDYKVRPAPARPPGRPTRPHVLRGPSSPAATLQTTSAYAPRAQLVQGVVPFR